MEFFARAEGLSAEAKAFALKNLRDLVNSYRNQENPVGNISGMEQLSQTWATAMDELSNAFAAREGMSDDELWEELFSDNGTLARWENTYKDSLIAQQKKVARYESGAITGEVDKTEKIKEWNLGSVLFEMKRDFSTIIGLSQSIHAELERRRPDVDPYEKLDDSINREISFKYAEREKKEYKEKNKTYLLSEASIVNLSKIDDLDEFERLYEERSPLSDELDKLLGDRLKEVEKFVKDKKEKSRYRSQERVMEDNKQAVKDYLTPRIKKLQEVCVETDGSEEMAAISAMEGEVSLAEKEVESSEQDVSKARSELDTISEEIQEKVRQIEADYEEDYGQEEREIDEKLKKLNEVDSQGNPVYTQKQFEEEMKNVQWSITFHEGIIERLEKRLAQPEDEQWIEELDERIANAKHMLYNEDLARETSEFKVEKYRDGIHSEEALEERLEIEKKDAYEKAHNEWETQVNELRNALLREEAAESTDIGKELVEDIDELKEEIEELNDDLSEAKKEEQYAKEELEENNEELKQLREDENGRPDIRQQRLEALAAQKDKLIAEQKRAYEEEIKVAPDHFKSEGWHKLLNRTKEEYTKYGPALLAANIAAEAADEIKNDPDDVAAEIDWKRMTLNSFNDNFNLNLKKKKYCEKCKTPEEHLKKEQEFDEKVKMQRGRVEKLVALTTSAFAQYTRVDENLDNRLKLSKFEDKYAPIKTQYAASKDSVKRYKERSAELSVAYLTEEIQRYQKNAETLMYGVRVYELKKNGDKKNLGYWEDQLDTPERKKFVERFYGITRSQEQLQQAFEYNQRRQKELSDRNVKLGEEQKKRDATVEKLTSEVKVKNTERENKKRQFKDLKNLAKDIVAKEGGTPEYAIEMSEKIAAYRQDGKKEPTAMQNAAAKLKELLGKEPQMGQVSSPAVDKLQRLKTTYAQRAKEMEDRIRQDSLAKYAQREKNALEKYKAEHTPEKIRAEIERKYRNEKDTLAMRKELIEKTKKRQIEEAAKPAIAAKIKLTEAEKRLNERTKLLQDKKAKLTELHTKHNDVLQKHKAVEGLLQLYQKETELIDNADKISTEVYGRSAIIRDIKKLENTHKEATNAENQRLREIKDGLTEKMFTPEKTKLLHGINDFLRTADVGRADMKKENSTEYKDMNNALAAFRNNVGNLTTTDQVAEQLRTIKAQAQNYIEKKEDEFGHKFLRYYSAQARVRLDYAQRLIDFCDKGIERMGKIPAQVEEMQGHIDSHMLAGYENRTTFFNEYVKPQLNNRDDREELTKENELRFRMDKQLAKMSEMFNGDPVAVHSVGIGLGESFQKAVEGKWPFTFFTFDKNENMTKWVEDYKDLNQKRQEMEKTIGIDKLFEPKVPEMEVIQDKKLPGDNLIRQNEVKDPVL